MGCHSLLQGIFPIQESNTDLPPCRQTLYQLNHQGSHFFHTCLMVSCVAFFCLLRWVYSYIFNSFYCNDNGIDALISLSELTLLVYINARDFGLLILYPATFPNSLISSRNFLILPVGFSMYHILETVRGNSERFVSPLIIWILFISFPSQIAVAGTCRTTLKNIGKSEDPCLLPDLRGKAFSFSPLKAACGRLIIFVLYQVEIGSFYTNFWKSLNHK